MRFKRPDLSKPLTRLRVALYLGAGTIFLLLVISAAFPLASNPNFCGIACHSQAPEYKSWQQSSHSKVTCYACHVDPAYSHLLKEKLIAGPTGIYNTLFNKYEKPINAHSHYSQTMLPMKRCERCHANENRDFTFSKGIYMNHKAHKDAEIDCAVCHNRIAHKGAENFEPLKSWPEAKELAEEEGHEKFAYKDFMGMKQGCFRCHSGSPDSRNPETLALIKNGKKPPTSCFTCHTKDFELPEGHDDVDWRSLHGSRAKKDFGYCFSCHGAQAKYNNAGKPWCTLCHDQAKVDSFMKDLPEAEHEAEGEHEPAAAEEYEPAVEHEVAAPAVLEPAAQDEPAPAEH